MAEHLTSNCQHILNLNRQIVFFICFWIKYMVKIAALVGHVAHAAALRFYKHIGPVQMGLWVTVCAPIKLTTHTLTHMYIWPTGFTKNQKLSTVLPTLNTATSKMFKHIIWNTKWLNIGTLIAEERWVTANKRPWTTKNTAVRNIYLD